MIFTIEPMINAGGYATKILSDGWTAVTRDRSLSAQFEHSIGITKDGAEIFSLSKKNYNYPPSRITVTSMFKISPEFNFLSPGMP